MAEKKLENHSKALARALEKSIMVIKTRNYEELLPFLESHNIWQDFKYEFRVTSQKEY